MEKLIKMLPFYSDLTDAEKKLCEMNSVVSKYKAGSYLLGECGSGECSGMIHVISGELRAFVVSEEGREITLFRIEEGENCILSAACVLSQITFDTQLYVNKDAELLIVPVSTFGKILEENIYVKAFTYELATMRFSSVMWVMQQILFLGFDKRLAHFLLDEYEKTGKTELHMTQEEIAVSTNSAREVVARMLKQFSEDGLIESRRGVIVLKNIAGLKKVI